MKLCAHCGGQNRDQATFCGHCGKPLTSGILRQTEPAGSKVMREGKIKEPLGEGGQFVEQELSPFSLSAYVGQEAIKRDLPGRIEAGETRFYSILPRLRSSSYCSMAGSS